MQRHHSLLLAGLTLIFGTMFFLRFALPEARNGWFALNGIGSALVVIWYLRYGRRRGR